MSKPQRETPVGPCGQCDGILKVQEQAGYLPPLACCDKCGRMTEVKGQVHGLRETPRYTDRLHG